MENNLLVGDNTNKGENPIKQGKLNFKIFFKSFFSPSKKKCFFADIYLPSQAEILRISKNTNSTT